MDEKEQRLAQELNLKVSELVKQFSQDNDCQAQPIMHFVASPGSPIESQGFGFMVLLKERFREPKIVRPS